MQTEKEYRGQCFCGAIEVRVSGAPAAAGYCHCASCRQWSAAPLNAFTLWPPAAVSVVRGADKLASFSKTDKSIRRWCSSCGGHVLTEHPLWSLTDVYAATIPEFPFKAALHVNYGETVMRVFDGLPKQHDLPAEMGGSGVVRGD
jgi:hypothetical protein